MNCLRQRMHRLGSLAFVGLALRAGACLLAIGGHAAAEDYRILPNVQKIRRPQFHAIACSPDSRFIAAAGGKTADGRDPGKLTIWDVDSGEIVLHRQDFPSTIPVVRFSPDGQMLAVISGDQAERRVFVYTLSLTLAGKRPVWGNPVRLDWPPQAGPSRTVRSMYSHLGDVCFSPSGKGIAQVKTQYPVASGLNLVRSDPKYLVVINYWDDEGKSRQFELAGTDESRCVRFLDENRLILDTLRDYQSNRPSRLLQVFDLTTGRVEREGPVQTDRHASRVGTGLDLSADRKWIAYTRYQEVRILRAETLEVVRDIEIGTYACMSLSPNGEVLAASVHTPKLCSVRFFDVQTGEEIASRNFERPDSPVIEFTADGKYLAAIDIDGGIRLWDMQQILPGRSLAPGDKRE
jgi:WD40 repeat protein